MGKFDRFLPWHFYRALAWNFLWSSSRYFSRDVMKNWVRKTRACHDLISMLWVTICGCEVIHLLNRGSPRARSPIPRDICKAKPPENNKARPTAGLCVNARKSRGRIARRDVRTDPTTLAPLLPSRLLPYPRLTESRACEAHRRCRPHWRLLRLTHRSLIRRYL